MNPKAIVITGYGINCEEETAKAFKMAGGNAQIVHINDLIDNPSQLDQFQIMAFPGGFSYGDDTGSGNAMANKIKNNILEQTINFAKQDKLVIGICNGCQMVANLGLAPAIDDKYGERQVALMHNAHARYECRWVRIKETSQKSIWLKGIDQMDIPVAHGEGNFYMPAETLKTLQDNDQIAARYINSDGTPADQKFPANPNGSLDDIAAISDPSGRILAIMPHPERFLFFTNQDQWQLKKEELLRADKPLPQEGDGLKIFKNAINYFSQ